MELYIARDDAHSMYGYEGRAISFDDPDNRFGKDLAAIVQHNKDLESLEFPQDLMSNGGWEAFLDGFHGNNSTILQIYWHWRVNHDRGHQQ